jgi:copper chaperone CopZ
MPHRPDPGSSGRRISHLRARLAAYLWLAVAGTVVAGPAPPPTQGVATPGPPRPGAVTALVLPVKGMTCALCTRGVETSIRLLDGVQAVTADLSSGLVRVQAVEGKSLNIKDVKDRVQKAGFRVEGECEVEAVGRFSLGPEGRITFRVPGTAYSFQVLEGSELKHLFQTNPGLKGDFLLDFRLHEHVRWKPSAISIVRAETHGAQPPATGL